MQYLEALESDAPMEAYPGTVYAQFFLRAYVRHLELNEDAMVSAFEDHFGAAEPARATVLPRKYRVLGEGARRIPAALRSGRKVSTPLAMLPERMKPAKKPMRKVALMPRPSRRLPGQALGDGKGSGKVLGAFLAVALVAGGVAVVLRASGSHPAGAAAVAAKPKATTPVASQLPTGGRVIFPKYRVVAFYGAPHAPQLGILGIGPQEAGQQLESQTQAYRQGDKPVLPAFEVIATLATALGGSDGSYRTRLSQAEIEEYVTEARRIKALTVLDVQPGRADFMPEVQVYGEMLKQPDIGLALDPEWHVGPNDEPGKVIGSTDAQTVNQVIQYLTGIVKKYNLPQKLLIVHQFTANMVEDRDLVKPTPQVAVVFDLDGFGVKAAKVTKYQTLSTDPRFHYGFKLFFSQDIGLMSPLDVLTLYPPPDLVVYQ